MPVMPPRDHMFLVQHGFGERLRPPADSRRRHRIPRPSCQRGMRLAYASRMRRPHLWKSGASMMHEENGRDSRRIFLTFRRNLTFVNARGGAAK